MNIGVGTVMITHRFPHLPVPVGTGAITPAIPDAQYEPGKSGQEHRGEMPFPGFGKDPSRDVEQRKSRVEEEKENIQKGIKHTGAKVMTGIVRVTGSPCLPRPIQKASGTRS